MCRHAVLFLTALGASVLRLASGGRAVVTVGNFEPWTYHAHIAKFGDDFDDGIRNANLMLPPDPEDEYLCRVPNVVSLQQRLNQSSVEGTAGYSENLPIAFFVSRGECSFEEKARNALLIQQNVSNLVQYVVVYNNETDAPDDLVVMATASKDEARAELNSLGMVFVSTTAGSDVLGRIADHSNSTNTSPYFLAATNEGWNLPLLIEVLPPQEPPGQQPAGSYPSSDRSSATNAFYWLRFVLFALLIVSPCCRAGYLWYQGGGRVHLRRDEQGRIIGLQYIRPMPYWFASGAATRDAGHGLSEKLTEEQVLALPEITFEPTEERESSVDEQDDEEQQPVESLGETSEEPQDSLQEIDVEQPPDGEMEAAENFTTSCTTCSICIDDFEQGERLRLLPRCRHAFHTDCIMPWLTERQGCCPLCKTSVMQNDEDVDAEEEQVDSEAEDEASNDSPA